MRKDKFLLRRISENVTLKQIEGKIFLNLQGGE